MKKLISLNLVLVVLLLLFTGCNAQKNDQETSQWEKVQKAGKLVVGTEGTYPPLSYHNDNGDLTGFDVEVAKAIGEKLGLEVEFVETDWDSLIAGLQAKRFDIVCNEVTPTDERKETYDFSDPYTYIYNVVITTKDNNEITKMEDLDGKKVSNTISSTHALIAKEYGAEIVAVDTFEASIEMVLQGRADATINSEMVYNEYLKVKPDANLKIAAYSVSAETTAIPVRKGETEMVNKLNEAIKALQEDGTLEKLSLEFFDEDITKKR